MSLRKQQQATNRLCLVRYGLLSYSSIAIGCSMHHPFVLIIPAAIVITGLCLHISSR